MRSSLICVACLCAASFAAAQTDYTDSATIEVRRQSVDNVAVAPPGYVLELWHVEGTVTTPTGVVVHPPAATGLPALPLFAAGPGAWFVEDVEFAGGFLGAFPFEVQGPTGLLDTLSPSYAPPAMGSFAFVTSPMPGSANVGLQPTFTWNQVSGWSGVAKIGIEMYDVTADVDLPGASLAIGATSWPVPQALLPNHTYQFEIGANVEVSTPAQSALGDPYTLWEIYAETNSVYFATCTASVAASEVVRVGTPPNPAALLPGQTSGPVVGKAWDPLVDHTAFQPGAFLDFLGVSGAQINVATAFGTLLCAPPAPGLTFFGPAGAAFELTIPLDCKLVGVPMCAQAASLDAGGPFELTNALDIVIGSF